MSNSFKMLFFKTKRKKLKKCKNVKRFDRKYLLKIFKFILW